MMEWQPIETAPRDGTEVIGVYRNAYSYQEKPTIYGPWTMRFDKNENEWVSSWDGERVIRTQTDFGTEYRDLDVEPTHWMPMPDANLVIGK